MNSIEGWCADIHTISLSAHFSEPQPSTPVNPDDGFQTFRKLFPNVVLLLQSCSTAVDHTRTDHHAHLVTEESTQYPTLTKMASMHHEDTLITKYNHLLYVHAMGSEKDEDGRVTMRYGLSVMMRAIGWRTMSQRPGSHGTDSRRRERKRSSVGLTRTTKTNAAMKLQLWFRRAEFRRKVHERTYYWGILTLQRWFRGCITRNRVRAQKLQRRCRLVSLLFSDHYHNAALRNVPVVIRAEMAVIRLQCWWRYVSAVRTTMSRRRSKNAVTVQRVFRGYMGRKAAARRREEILTADVQTHAATSIQKVVRGFLTRRRVRLNRTSLVSQCIRQRLTTERQRRVERVQRQLESLEDTLTRQRDVREQRLVLQTVLSTTTSAGGDVNERVLQQFSVPPLTFVHPHAPVKLPPLETNGGGQQEVLSWGTGVSSGPYIPPEELKAGIQMMRRIQEQQPYYFSNNSNYTPTPSATNYTRTVAGGHHHHGGTSAGVRSNYSGGGRGTRKSQAGGGGSSDGNVTYGCRTLADVKRKATDVAVKRMLRKPPQSYAELVGQRGDSM